MVAFLGASSAFVESTLGQVYKEKINGEYRGGPAFYIERGLGVKWFAWLFAIVTIFSCGLFLPGVQANAIATSMENAFGIEVAQLADVAKCGLSQINVDTDIRLAVTRNFRELFRDHPELKDDPKAGGVWKLLDEKRDAFDPRAFLAPIMDTVMYGTGDEGAVARITDAMRRGVKEAVGTLIVEFGSYGKAPLVEPATLEDMAARYAKEG